MADLSKFSAQERNLLVSLPYRVGVWISNVDDNAGTQIDDKDERKVLEQTIAKFAEASDKIPVAAAVMQDVQSSKSSWVHWDSRATEASVLDDASKVVEITKGHFDDKQLNQYRETIWRIGVFVAQAYGEHVDPDNEMHFNNFFGRLLGKSPKAGKNPENMSPKEKQALTKLKAALKGADKPTEIL